MVEYTQSNAKKNRRSTRTQTDRRATFVFNLTKFISDHLAPADVSQWSLVLSKSFAFQDIQYRLVTTPIFSLAELGEVRLK